MTLSTSGLRRTTPPSATPTARASSTRGPRRASLNPLPIAGGLGSDGLGRRRHPLPRLLQPARQRQHRLPAPEGRRGDPGAGGDPHHGRARCRERDPRRGGAPHHRARARGLREGVLHQRRRRRERERDPHGAPRSPAATRSSRSTARTTATPARPSSRPATGAASPTSTPAATCTSSAPTSTAPSSGPRRPSRSRERALHHLERVVQAEGPESIAAILLETIPGTAGILTPPPGYLAGVRAIADRYGILLILDEVMAGFGRTGEWFAFDAFDVRPDLITFAKGVNSGYVPIGGVIISDADRAPLRRARLPGRAHLLRPPARRGECRRDPRRDGRGGHRRATRRRIGSEHLGPASRPRGEARRHRRGPRLRRLLGARARRGPRHPRAARPPRRRSPEGRPALARPPAVHRRQPHPRRPARRRDRRRGRPGIAIIDAALGELRP